MRPRSLAALLLAAVALALPAPAEAAACSGTSGVTVLVQFPDHTVVGCAAGDPSSGYQALSRAGFSVTFATGNGTGAICSINGYPDHACPSMPPQSAYWAYFHAKPGGSWSYSNTGGGGYNPKPGTVEGWRFGSGSAPTSAPPGTSSTPRPTPAPTSHPTSHPTSGSSNPVVKPVSSGHPGSTGSSGSPTAPDATSSSPTGTPSGGTTTSPTTSANATDDVLAPEVPGPDAAGSVSSHPSAGRNSSGNHSWIWGVLLVALLAGAAVTTAFARRKA